MSCWHRFEIDSMRDLIISLKFIYDIYLADNRL